MENCKFYESALTFLPLESVAFFILSSILFVDSRSRDLALLDLLLVEIFSDFESSFDFFSTETFSLSAAVSSTALSGVGVVLSLSVEGDLRPLAPLPLPGTV